jgi:hypothetical protein
MARMDWEKERQRLTALYAGMEDGELEKITADFDALNEAVQQVLRDEMSKRGLAPLPLVAAPASVPQQAVELPAPEILRRYVHIVDALIAKSVLDSAGIESILSDDNLIRMDWFVSNAVGGVKLIVRHEDLEAAASLLDQETPGKFDLSGIGEYEQPKCPQCGSMDITLDELDKQVKGVALFLKLPLRITNKGWTCHSCGNRWPEEETPTTTDAGIEST